MKIQGLGVNFLLGNSEDMRYTVVIVFFGQEDVRKTKRNTAREISWGIHVWEIRV